MTKKSVTRRGLQLGAVALLFFGLAWLSGLVPVQLADVSLQPVALAKDSTGAPLSPGASVGVAGEGEAGFDYNRARLLSYVLRRQVEHHYSGKAIDDELSTAAFRLYLKQLDSQKRFLLNSEVEKLRGFEKRIDDEINSGNVALPVFGAELMDAAIPRAEQLAHAILAEPFDLLVDESYETDAEKLSFCNNVDELRERWRQELKYRTVTRYLNLMEDAGIQDVGKVTAVKSRELERTAREKVRKSYDDYFSRMRKETRQDHYDRYLNAFVRAFDPHSSFMAPSDKEDFDIGMRGSLEGIGATLREEDGYIKVVKVIPGSAADRQGELHVDDIILAVGQGAAEPVDVTDMRLRDAVALIRGEKGTEVRLTIRRAGHTPFVLPITRDVVLIEESFVKSAVVNDPGSGARYGYVKIPSFYRDFEQTRGGGAGRNSTDDVRKALVEFRPQNIDGVILDLRNNGGGALTDAVGVTGLFIESGPVVQIRTSGGYQKVLKDENAAIEYSGPLVVLVNEFSASASEIVAGALQDYGRALIVGSEHTHGKGTVQVIMDLDQAMPLKNMARYMPLGALKLTTQKFYRISGDSTQYRGVVPDLILPDRRQYNKFGERYLDYSLPWDSIDPVTFDAWTTPVRDVERLTAASRNRVGTDAEFVEIRRTAEVLRDRLEDTRQTLRADQVYAEWNAIKGEESPHGDGVGAHGADPGEAADVGNDPQKLARQLMKDPYVREVVTVLGEVRAEQGVVAGGKRVLHAN